MTSSPCSSSIDESATSISSIVSSYQTQQIYSTKYHDRDENDVCNFKENMTPLLSYYSEAIAADNVEGNPEYDRMANDIYSSSTMQPTEHISYSSKFVN